MIANTFTCFWSQLLNGKDHETETLEFRDHEYDKSDEKKKMMIMTEMTRILFSEPSSYTCAHCGLLLDSALALIQVCGDKSPHDDQKEGTTSRIMIYTKM